MNNKWQTHTSEKLFLAELQLKEWGAQLEEHGGNLSQPIQTSFKQASMLLISLGWESLLNELAEYHQQKNTQVVNLKQLKLLLGKDTPEIAYLSEVASNPESWLYELIGFEQRLKQPQPRGSDYATLLAKDALITASSHSEPVDSLNNIQRIVSEFKAYLRGLRERMSEW